MVAHVLLVALLGLGEVALPRLQIKYVVVSHHAAALIPLVVANGRRGAQDCPVDCFPDRRRCIPVWTAWRMGSLDARGVAHDQSRGIRRPRAGRCAIWRTAFGAGWRTRPGAAHCWKNARGLANSALASSDQASGQLRLGVAHDGGAVVDGVPCDDLFDASQSHSGSSNRRGAGGNGMTWRSSMVAGWNGCAA